MKTFSESSGLMKFATKFPEADNAKHTQLIKSGWIPLKEPRTLLRASLLSIPFMFINALITFVIISLFITISMDTFGFASESESVVITIDGGMIIAFILMVLLHEAIHLFLVPRFLTSNKTLLGINYLGAFVYSEEEISWIRYILITIGPYVLLSVVLPIILSLSGIMTPFLIVLVLLNAAASSVDMLSCYIVLWQAPRKSKLISNGLKTYWKSAS